MGKLSIQRLLTLKTKSCLCVNMFKFNWSQHYRLCLSTHLGMILAMLSVLNSLGCVASVALKLCLIITADYASHIGREETLRGGGDCCGFMD